MCDLGKKYFNNGCPYCESEVNLIDSSNIYNGVSYGFIYICSNYTNCKSYVGCHPGTNVALGRLANNELRFWKKEAHKYFDQLWISKKINKIYRVFLPDTSNRKKAYIWLSQKLGISIDDTHIGMFDVDTCKKVVEICKPYCNE